MDRPTVVTFARDATRDTQIGTVVTKIEDVLEDIVDALDENRELTIPLRSRPSGNERNIYYQYPDLFGNQQYVDNLIDDIAFTFGVGRDALNIVAAFKGLIAGNVIVTSKDDSILNCSSDSNGTLIPRAEAIHRIDIGQAKWILVIEKEATFRGLAESRYFEESAAGRGVLVTVGSLPYRTASPISGLQIPQGKGYPDLLTRQFLNLLHSAFPQLPVYALVDFDPSGINIMLTYKHGSLALSHEQNTTVPGLSWLGPKSSDILGYYHDYFPSTHSPQTNQPLALTPPSSQEPSCPPSLSSQTLSVNEPEVFSHLTTLDRRKAVGLLRKLDMKQNQSIDEVELVHELQLMLILNIKAEIQAVDDAGDMTGWLDGKLSDRLH
ncbi:DNA topoisomerase IV, alpha subunit [Hypoxylon crocopeplum]|nr:DNA topoisomerase IV, alpha subunit [Hypoxylon crocopeplum]